MKKVGQITIKKIGKKWAICISGTPQELFNSYKAAEVIIEKVRKKHGRKHYKYKRKKK